MADNIFQASMGETGAATPPQTLGLNFFTTMEEIKAKTNLEKLGFLDSDRKSPTHDEIQLWLLNNATEIVSKIFKEGTQFEVTDIFLEQPIIQVNNHSGYKSIIGYADAFIETKIITDTQLGKKGYYFCIEIKSKIDSFGDLVRQIHTYKRFLDGQTIFVVISPDDRYAAALKTQNIKFVKYTA